MTFSKLERKRILPVYNKLVGEATSVYLNAEPEGLNPVDRSEWRRSNPTIDTSRLSDGDFLDYVLESNRQPMNPVELARKALGLDESATEEDISDGLRQAYLDLQQTYTDNNVDPAALSLVVEMLSLTEAYIAGYSREIGELAITLATAEPVTPWLKQRKPQRPFDALKRWNDKIWVPDEDMHDKTIEYLLNSVPNMTSLTSFYSKHIRHMKIGNHVDLSSVFGSTGYVRLQEGATVTSYGNAVKIFGPVYGYIFLKILQNEAHHTRAYDHMLSELVMHFPDQAVLEVEDACDEFEMPGKAGIEGYTSMAQRLGLIGLLDPKEIDTAQSQLLTSLRLGEIDLTTERAKASRDRLLSGQNKGALERRKAIPKIVSIREKSIERARKAGKLLPIIVGETVTCNPRNRELIFLQDAA